MRRLAGAASTGAGDARIASNATRLAANDARSIAYAADVGDPDGTVLLAEDVPPAKLVHIPNGVPLDRIREGATSGLTRADIGVSEDAKVVIHVARFYPMKRQAWTLEAVRRRLRGESAQDSGLSAGEWRELVTLIPELAQDSGHE